MPELPDVEVFRRRVDRAALRKPIRNVEVLAPNMLWNAKAVDVERLIGRTFTGTERVGKWLFVRTETPLSLVLHFGMTGDVSVVRDGAEPPHTRLRVEFQGGERLFFQDMRMFGEISVTDSVSGFLESRNVGPDALALSEAEWLQRLAGKRGGLKAALMGQNIVAGLGNLWVDELLYQVGLSPLASVQRLDVVTRRRMFRTMKRILAKGIEVGEARELDWGRLPRSYMLSARAAGGRCPKDRTPWKVATVAGRTTYWCPKHQRLPRRR